jgi:hypothetical protein
MYIKLLCPLLLSLDVRVLPFDVFLGIPDSILIAPKLLTDRAECADWMEAELPPPLLM